MENTAITTPPIAGPVNKIDVPTMNPTKVNMKDMSFLNIVVDCL